MGGKPEKMFWEWENVQAAETTLLPLWSTAYENCCEKNEIPFFKNRALSDVIIIMCQYWGKDRKRCVQLQRSSFYHPDFEVTGWLNGWNGRFYLLILKQYVETENYFFSFLLSIVCVTPKLPGTKLFGMMEACPITSLLLFLISKTTSSNK